MARMIPEYIHRNCKSSAEHRLFNRFRLELSDNYVVLHSLWLAKHNRKLQAEIDFVVASRRGIICIEVKGGRIRQERGVWYFINRYDEVATKRESPFKQASSGMYALKNGIKNKFGWNSPQCNAVIGYAVIFPDQPFYLESPEWDLNRLIDGNMVGKPLQKLIEKQFDYSAQEIRRVGAKDCVRMSHDRFDQLLKYLRPDFEMVPSLSSMINESHYELLRLTEEQYDVLDQLGVNDRIIIRGSAGTGKTLLAVERVRREAQRGREVCYICYNKLLAMHVRDVLKRETCVEHMEVNTLHGYARKLIAKVDLDKYLRSESENILFTEKFPELFEKAFIELFEESPFFTLVVDEGQDLQAEPYIRMLDWMVKGGLKKGRWIWFEDSMQNIFRSDAGIAEWNSLERYHPAKCQLTKNCRNAKPISIFNSLTTDTEKQKCLVDSNLKVVPSFYKSIGHQRKLLENIITRLLGSRVKPLDIVILSPHIPTKTVLKGLDRIGGITLRPYDEYIGTCKKALRYTTIQKFKGLESKVVIVTDINDLESKDMRSLNYVAFSRPTSCLEVLIHKEAREQYEQLAYKFGLRD